MDFAVTDQDIPKLLTRIADALERLAPAELTTAPLKPAIGYMWNHHYARCDAVDKIHHIPLATLKGVESQSAKLYDNTKAFAEGKLANNALLWGARGTGKSSLIKAVHGALRAEGYDLSIVEIAREDIADLPVLMRYLSTQKGRFIVYCDDLAFEASESSYKALKAALEGGLSGRPHNIVFYASSNRRHLMARQMIDNERATAINPSEAIEEKISLSDRFGLWIGFHSIDQEGYLAIIDSYIAHYQLPVSLDDIRQSALQWAMERGHRSGRTAHQYITDLAAKLDIKIDL